MYTAFIHLSWFFRSLRALRSSVFFLIALALAALVVNTPLISAEELLSQSTTQTTVSDATTTSTSTTKPATLKPEKVTKKPSTATAKTSSTTPTPQTQRPASTPVVAPTPAPAYDTVSIPSIGFSSRLVTVGLTATNAVDVHPSLVGWWNGSARPGSNGAAFLDGHNPGVFSSLPNIKVGAQITVKFASGESYTYKVVHRETIPLVNVDMNKALTPYGGASQGLNLMTCMGAYNPATGTTDERLIVYAVR